MTIKIWVNKVNGGWSPQQAFLAGTENFVRQFAEESVRRGHKTIVYQNGFFGTHNGVTYEPHKSLNSECDTLLIVKEASLLDIELKAKRVIYYTNDIEDEMRLMWSGRMKQVSKVMALSKYHRSYLLMGVPNVHIVSHGITRDDPPYEKEPYLCLYSSSHDRGLRFLLEIWPNVLRAVPQAKLEIAYNGRTEKEMEELYKKADYWLYPCRGVELYCIAGIRAQAHGCYPIVIPTMALEETVKYGQKVSQEEYEDTVIRMMTKDRDKIYKERQKMIDSKWPSPQSEWDEIMI